MKTLLIALGILIAQSVQGQVIQCSGIPIAYGNVEFKQSTWVTSDSMVSFSISNQHPAQGFAYPLAKLVPLTPLPPGMALTPGSEGWTVFSSSWNPGDTMPVEIYYSVSNSIPQDYTVTFELWASNFSPLSVDSCYFTNTFTLNLNPSSSFISNRNKNKWNIYFDNSCSSIVINAGKPFYSAAVMQLYDTSGRLIQQENLESTINENRFSLPHPMGIYIVQINNGNEFYTQKIIIE